MRKVWRGIVRTIFWSYERGSWPYDAFVIAILCFVLLTPRSWFHDQPQASSSLNPGVELVDQDSSGDTRTYRIDAKLLAPEKRKSKVTPELERETHDILRGNVDDLKGRTFQVAQINPLLDDKGVVLSYDVTVRSIK
jgi:hypothetical protein